jgi:hypothetical protein
MKQLSSDQYPPDKQSNQLMGMSIAAKDGETVVQM